MTSQATLLSLPSSVACLRSNASAKNSLRTTSSTSDDSKNNRRNGGCAGSSDSPSSTISTDTDEKNKDDDNDNDNKHDKHQRQRQQRGSILCWRGSRCCRKKSEIPQSQPLNHCRRYRWSQVSACGIATLATVVPVCILFITTTMMSFVTLDERHHTVRTDFHLRHTAHLDALHAQHSEAAVNNNVTTTSTSSATAAAAGLYHLGDVWSAETAATIQEEFHHLVDPFLGTNLYNNNRKKKKKLLDLDWRQASRARARLTFAPNSTEMSIPLVSGHHPHDHDDRASSCSYAQVPVPMISSRILQSSTDPNDTETITPPTPDGCGTHSHHGASKSSAIVPSKAHHPNGQTISFWFQMNRTINHAAVSDEAAPPAALLHKKRNHPNTSTNRAPPGGAIIILWTDQTESCHPVQPPHHVLEGAGRSGTTFSILQDEVANVDRTSAIANKPLYTWHLEYGTKDGQSCGFLSLPFPDNIFLAGDDDVSDGDGDGAETEEDYTDTSTTGDTDPAVTAAYRELLASNWTHIGVVLEPHDYHHEESTHTGGATASATAPFKSTHPHHPPQWSFVLYLNGVEVARIQEMIPPQEMEEYARDMRSYQEEFNLYSNKQEPEEISLPTPPPPIISLFATNTRNDCFVRDMSSEEMAADPAGVFRTTRKRNEQLVEEKSPKCYASETILGRRSLCSSSESESDQVAAVDGQSSTIHTARMAQLAIWEDVALTPTQMQQAFESPDQMMTPTAVQVNNDNGRRYMSSEKKDYDTSTLTSKQPTFYYAMDDVAKLTLQEKQDLTLDMSLTLGESVHSTMQSTGNTNVTHQEYSYSPYYGKLYKMGVPSLEEEYEARDKGGYRYSAYINGTYSTEVGQQVRNVFEQQARTRRQYIRNAMKHAWKGYQDFAWGYDELKPRSQMGANPWGGMGTTLVDSLDTMWLMGMHDEFYEARDWVRDHLHHEPVTKKVSVFETTIRSVGGLLAAYDMSHDAVFLERAEDLGYRLFRAIGNRNTNNTQSGDAVQNEPYSTNTKPSNTSGASALKKGQPVTPSFPLGEADIGGDKDDEARQEHPLDPFSENTNIAELGTLQVEFRYLSDKTGNETYAKTVEALIEMMNSVSPINGLYPIFVSKDLKRDVVLLGGPVTFGAMGDSFYEYTLKVWLQGGKTEPMYRSMYDKAIDGMHDELLFTSEPSGLTYITETQGMISKRLSHKMDHLACFSSGKCSLQYCTVCVNTISFICDRHLHIDEIALLFVSLPMCPGVTDRNAGPWGVHQSRRAIIRTIAARH
jgi:hypothetical protein